MVEVTGAAAETGRAATAWVVVVGTVEAGLEWWGAVEVVVRDLVLRPPRSDPAVPECAEESRQDPRWGNLTQSRQDGQDTIRSDTWESGELPARQALPHRCP